MRKRERLCLMLILGFKKHAISYSTPSTELTGADTGFFLGGREQNLPPLVSGGGHRRPPPLVSAPGNERDILVLLYIMIFIYGMEFNPTARRRGAKIRSRFLRNGPLLPPFFVLQT